MHPMQTFLLYENCYVIEKKVNRCCLLIKSKSMGDNRPQKTDNEAIFGLTKIYERACFSLCVMLRQSKN